MPENTAENRTILAEEIASCMDVDDLIEVAVCSIEETYLRDNERFQREWVECFSDEDDVNEACIGFIF